MFHTILPQDMKRVEQRMMAGTGTASLTLMERAATHLADAAAPLLRGGGRLLAVCGAGNNGADGLAAARLLMQRMPALHTTVWQLPGNATAETTEQWARLKPLMGRVTVAKLSDGDPLPVVPAHVQCALDAMFGTGLARPLAGAALLAAQALNDSGVAVVAADIPSGLCGITGCVLGAATGGQAVRAAVTVTFHRPKQGLFLADGLDLCGRVIVADIGIPAVWDDAPGMAVLAAGDRLLPVRRRNSHKGNYGRVLLLCGSAGMAGAAAIAAMAALRAGAGLATVACPRAIMPTVQALCPCATCLPLPDPDAYATPEAAAKAAFTLLKPALAQADAAVIGCGLGQSATAGYLLMRVLAWLTAHDTPAVLDADALNWLASRGAGMPPVAGEELDADDRMAMQAATLPTMASATAQANSNGSDAPQSATPAPPITDCVYGMPDHGGTPDHGGMLDHGKTQAAPHGAAQPTAHIAQATYNTPDRGEQLPAPAIDTDAPAFRLPDHIVITPHIGEAARLLRTTARAVQADQPAAARALRAAYGGSVVLKSASTVLACADGEAINLYGTPAMAKGGSGDALAGVLGAMLAGQAEYGLRGVRLLQTACALHGLAGMTAAEVRGERGLLATDLCDALGRVPDVPQRGMASLAPLACSTPATYDTATIAMHDPSEESTAFLHTAPPDAPARPHQLDHLGPLGRHVRVTVDRPLGTCHPEHRDIVYQLNYGYVFDVLAADNEWQDAYIWGVKEPVVSFEGVVVAVIHRLNDVEDKWVVAAEGTHVTDAEIREGTRFQERFFKSEVWVR